MQDTGNGYGALECCCHCENMGWVTGLQLSIADLRSSAQVWSTGLSFWVILNHRSCCVNLFDGARILFIYFLQHLYCEGKTDLWSPHVTRVSGVSQSRMRFNSILKLCLHCRFWRSNIKSATQVNSQLIKCFGSLFKCSFSLNQCWPTKGSLFQQQVYLFINR